MSTTIKKQQNQMKQIQGCVTLQYLCSFYYISYKIYIYHVIYIYIYIM